MSHLFPLIAQAVPAMLAPHAHPEGANVIAYSGAAVADLNMLFMAEHDPRFLARGLAEAVERRLPVLALLAFEASPEGLTNAGTVPVMAMRGAPAPSGSGEVARVTRDDIGTASCLQADAFGLPQADMENLLAESLALANPPEVYLARRGDATLSTVTITRHGGTAGIWTMATPPRHQRKGAGRMILTHVMADLGRQGVEEFFLIATEAGKPLYDSLGFETVATLSAWVSGQSTQI